MSGETVGVTEELEDLAGKSGHMPLPFFVEGSEMEKWAVDAFGEGWMAMWVRW